MLGTVPQETRSSFEDDSNSKMQRESHFAITSRVRDPKPIAERLEQLLQDNPSVACEIAHTAPRNWQKKGPNFPVTRLAEETYILSNIKGQSTVF